jgi:hypothetical protein
LRAREHPRVLRIVALALACALLAVSEPASPKSAFDILGANANIDVVRNGERLPASLVPFLIPGDDVEISFPKEVQFSRSPRWHLIVADMYSDYQQRAPRFAIADADLSRSAPGHVWSIDYNGDATLVFFLVPEDGSRYGRGIPDARAAIEDLRNRALLLKTATLSADAEAKESTLASFVGSLASIQPGELPDGRARITSATQSLFGSDLGDSPCFTTNSATSTQYACAAQAITSGYESTPDVHVAAAVGSELSVNAATYGMLIGAVYQLLAKRRVAAHYTFIPGVIKPGSQSTTIYVAQQPDYDATAARPSTIVYFEIGSKDTNPPLPSYGAAPPVPACLAENALQVSLPFNGLPIYFRSHRIVIHAQQNAFDLPATYDPLRGYRAALSQDQVQALSAGGSASIVSLWGFDDVESPQFDVVEPHDALWQLATPRPSVISGQKSAQLTFTNAKSPIAGCVQSIAVHDGAGQTIPVTALQRTSNTITATLDPSAALGATGAAVVSEAGGLKSAPLDFVLLPAMPSITDAIAYLPRGVLVLRGKGLKYIDTVTLLNTGITFANGTPNADGSWSFTAQKPATYQAAWEHESMTISFTLQPPDTRTSAVEADVEYAAAASK